ncbi:MAG: hypothetical protein IRZ26_07850 [Clostridia bacterium]|nr:hypothetical protein [Clostridia bacterium]
MNGMAWLLAALLLHALATVAGLGRGAAGRSAWGAVLAAANGATLVAALQVLAGRGGTVALDPFWILGPLVLRADPLGGWFLLVTGFVGLAVGVYSVGYYARPGHDDRRVRALLPVTLASLLLIVTAGEMVTFLVAWEAMAVLSYLLVALGEEEEAPGAALFMLVLSEVGTLAVLAALLWISGETGTTLFARQALEAGAWSPALRAWAFTLAFAGFAVKAGLLPLNVWLPAAHPVAPSPVSALLSTAIVNMGVYGILRTASLVGPLPSWVGLLVLALGAATAITGILYALLEVDLKRMLAQSTIENMGLVAVGTGAALTFAGAGRPALAGLALVAALFHLLNHSLFKADLFLGAGTVAAEAGTRSMDRLGGIVRTAPWLASAWLVGALGLSALPPLPGFASEWLTLQSLLHVADLPSGPWQGIFVAAGAVLALAVGLAVTAFVRAFGIGFLGAPRGEASRRPVAEPGRAELGGLWLLAGGAIAAGLLPTALFPALGRAAAVIAGTDVTDALVPPVFVAPERYAGLVDLGGAALRGLLPVRGAVIVPLRPDAASISGTYMWLAFTLFTGLALVLAAAGRARAVRRQPAWTGGSVPFDPAMQYTASAYVVPERNLFAPFYGASSEARAEAGRPHFPERIRYRWRFVPLLEERLYRPLGRAGLALSQAVQRLQSGNLNAYLTYLLVVLVLTLGVALVAR